MKPAEFVDKFYPYALKVEQDSGIPAEAILTQAAIESGWGEVCPGNMFFGVKDTDGINGNEQLITTTEYSRRADLYFPEIISVTPVLRNGLPYFKYKVKDWFREYKTPYESFLDHANFLTRNPRYAEAFKTSDPTEFLKRIARAGYATDTGYEDLLMKVLSKILKLVGK